MGGGVMHWRVTMECTLARTTLTAAEIECIQQGLPGGPGEPRRLTDIVEVTAPNEGAATAEAERCAPRGCAVTRLERLG